MSEEQAEYLADVLEMINTHPTVEIEPPRSVVARRGRENIEEDRPACIKFSTGFKKELSSIDAVSLKVWIFIALSINRNTGKANPGLRTIAAGVGMGVNTVQAALIRLDKKYNLLSIDRESRKYNIYEPLAFVSANKSDPSVSATDTTVSEKEQTVSEKQESVSHTRILNQSNQSNQIEPRNDFSSSKEKPSKSVTSHVPEGFPEPTGDLLADWDEIGRRHSEKVKPFVEVIEALAKGFPYNFPKYGENMALDRVAKLIAQDGRDVQVFIRWAKDNKRDPHWYHIKPDSLWGDWSQAFTTKPKNKEFML
jgi:hypothetical protein